MKDDFDGMLGGPWPTLHQSKIGPILDLDLKDGKTNLLSTDYGLFVGIRGQVCLVSEQQNGNILELTKLKPAIELDDDISSKEEVTLAIWDRILYAGCDGYVIAFRADTFEKIAKYNLKGRRGLTNVYCFAGRIVAAAEGRCYLLTPADYYAKYDEKKEWPIDKVNELPGVGKHIVHMTADISADHEGKLIFYAATYGHLYRIHEDDFENHTTTVNMEDVKKESTVVFGHDPYHNRKAVFTAHENSGILYRYDPFTLEVTDEARLNNDKDRKVNLSINGGLLAAGVNDHVYVFNWGKHSHRIGDNELQMNGEELGSKKNSVTNVAFMQSHLFAACKGYIRQYMTADDNHYKSALNNLSEIDDNLDEEVTFASGIGKFYFAVNGRVGYMFGL